MTRAEIDAETARVTAKLKASTNRDGSVKDGLSDRVLAIQARLDELEAMTADDE